MLIFSAETLVVVVVVVAAAVVVVVVAVVAAVAAVVPVLVFSCLFPPAVPFVWLPQSQRSPPPPEGAQRSNKSAGQLSAYYVYVYIAQM